VAQAQQSMLMQLPLRVHQQSILRYFMLQLLPHDDSLTSAAEHAKSACNLL